MPTIKAKNLIPSVYAGLDERTGQAANLTVAHYCLKCNYAACKTECGCSCNVVECEIEVSL